jgi:hypothetical protein
MASTLIVEDGTIVANADSYETAANATTYHAARGNTAWAALTEAQKDEAMRKGATYLDGKYHHRWKGYQVSPLTQNRDWPRAEVKISNNNAYAPFYSEYLAITTIPQRLKDAQCEAALRAASDTLAADLQDGVKSKDIGGAISTTYVTSSGAAVKKYQIIDQLLVSLLASGSDVERG